MSTGNQVTQVLAAGVKQGKLSTNDARATVALLRWAGHVSGPDATRANKLFRVGVKDMGEKVKTKTPTALAGTKAGRLFNGAKVLDAANRLSAKKHEVRGKSGHVLKWGAKNVETASEKDHAIVGVWFKRLMQKF